MRFALHRFGSIIDVAVAGPGLASMSNEFGVASNNVYTAANTANRGHRSRVPVKTADWDNVPPLDGYSVVGTFGCWG